MKKTALIIVISILFLLNAFSLEKNNQRNISLTELEKDFIERNPIIKLGIDPKFYPFEFIDRDGEYKGIVSDYLEIIGNKTGLKFEISKDLTWPEAYEKAINGYLDGLPGISKTEEREQYFLFSDSYYNFRRVIVIRDSETRIRGIQDLFDRTVAVQKNSSHHSYLLFYPNINLSLYDSVEGALTAVANGTEDIFVGNLATTNYLIRSFALTNLKFIAFDTEDPQTLHFAVRKEMPELINIINKVLSSISEEEKITIRRKWIDVDSDTDYTNLIRALVIMGSIIALIIIVSTFWIFKLKKEVGRRKKIQLELEKAKQDAEEANKFKSNFLARMSHEIRTPLNAITGMSYLMKKTELGLTQKLYLERIIQAATNMLSIINDILDFSKIEAGKIELENASFSMDQVIQNIVNIVSYKIDEKKIGFKLSKDPSIPNWLIGDSKRIEQILINLLNNSAKFTSSGEVSLEIKLIAKQNNKYHLSFTVKDTGIGMTEEQVKKLFRPFTQADTTINRRFGGTGLGLSIVKNLVNMMEGDIQVYSMVGEGTTFVIQISFEADKQKEDEIKKMISEKHFENVKALVLEKTGSNINMIESYLRSFGISCELTTSENSAKSMLEASNSRFDQNIDLFIIDYETPEEGGFKFINSLRNNKNINKFPKVIMLIPLMREDLFDKLKDYGIDVGVGKPVIPSVLFNALLEVFKLKAVGASSPILDRDMAFEKDLDGFYQVLVVDDNKTNQMIAESLLKPLGLEVILADNGKDGVDSFKEFKSSIDLILMDLHMPIMNGYDASVEIRKISKTVPIIAMTADVILGVKEKCEQVGIDHYISKPFDPDKFIEVVKRFLIEKKKTLKNNEITVLDAQYGLKNVGGNKEVFEKILKEYYEENKDLIARLKQLIDDKNYTEAALVIHKIKSSSGSIGAKELYDLCIKFQKSLEKSDMENINLLYIEFEEIFQKLITEIQNRK